MAEDEFEVYFQRAKIEETLYQFGLPSGGRRRSSLPVISLTTDISAPTSTKYRRQSVKNTRKKSSPYAPHELNFPSTIPEVSCAELDELDENMVILSEPTRRRSRVSDTKLDKAPLSDNIEERYPNGENDLHSKEEHDRERSTSPQSDHYEEVCFVRNFRTSPKGIENRGDSVKRTRRSSTATCSFEHSGGRKRGTWLTPQLSALDFAEVALRATSLKNCEITRSVSNILRNSYKVLIIGDKQVGKTSLTRQLMTSHFLAALDSPQDTADMTTLSVTLDGEETVIELEEYRPTSNYDENIQAASAYIVLYAVDSFFSFDLARNYAEECVRQHGQQAAVLLVANKSDLVRKRVVNNSEAKRVCKKLGCKFVEVSVALSHNVDNLLVGIIKQIHLNPKRETHHINLAAENIAQVPISPRTKARKSKTTNCFPFACGLTKKLSLKHVTQTSHDCENLSVL